MKDVKEQKEAGVRMYKVLTDNEQVIAVHRDEEENIVIDDYQYEVEDLNTGKQYRISVYSLQDGTDNIRVNFDLWNQEDGCFEETGYGFYDSDGGQIAESAGEDLDDLELQEKVISRLFDYDMPFFATTVDLNVFSKGTE